MAGDDKRSGQGRRRPLQQTVRPKTFSYYSQQAGERPRPKAEKSIDMGQARSRWRLLPSAAIIAAIIASFLFSLTLSSDPVVSTVNDEPAVYRPLSEYAAAAKGLMAESPGNRTKLTINTKNIEQALVDRFPELEAAVLRLPVLGRKPSLIVDISSPVLLLAAFNKVYAVNSTGMITADAATLSSEAKSGLPVVRDRSGLEVSVGSQTVTTETVSFIRSVKAQLDAKQLKASELALPAAWGQLDIRLEGVRYYIKTDTSGDAKVQIGSYLAVIEQGIRPSEYIDVRVEGKVFYK